MRVVLATMGSRGEVQPVAALAVRLRELGAEVLVCVSPDFQDWIEGLGVPMLPLGPRMRDSGWDLATPAGRARAAEEAVAAQFATLPWAAGSCDVLVSCGNVSVAARSAAELAGVRHLHAEFCPAALPSPRHAPIPWPGWPRAPLTWTEEAQRWQDTWGPALNAHRAAAGLSTVDDVRGHVLTDRPWLAADPVLAPWTGGPQVRQTGAWLLPDQRPLPADLADFLTAGEPPVYFGLGSYSGVDGARTGQAMLAAARACGRRAILASGWADLGLPAEAPDCFLLGEANHHALFPRLAAIVHHGGAGTTTTAARAGIPQVLLPQHYDQHYWAEQVTRLGIGRTGPHDDLTADSLTTALNQALRPEMAVRAQEVGSTVRGNGAEIAAEHLLEATLSAGRP